MGTGNLTELTEADSGGIAAILVGLCSELDIRNVLTVQVSPHTRRTIEEHDAARRLMFAAAADGALPKGYDAGLLALHDLAPYPSSAQEIAGIAEEVRDAARAVPAELILVETDCPYLAPQPVRGKTNEPAYVVHNVAALAEARGEDAGALAAQIDANASAAFALP